MPILTFAAAATEGFQRTVIETPFITWNAANIIILIIAGIICLFTIFFLADHFEDVIITVIIGTVFFFGVHFVTHNITKENVETKVEETEISKFENWLNDRYGLTELPKDIVHKLYNQKEITILNVGTVELLQQGENTYYLVYADNAKELPLIAETPTPEEEPEKQETNW